MKNIILICTVGLALTCTAAEAKKNAGQGSFAVPIEELQLTAHQADLIILVTPAQQLTAIELTAPGAEACIFPAAEIMKLSSPALLQVLHKDPGRNIEAILLLSLKHTLAGRKQSSPLLTRERWLECIKQC